MKNHMTSKGYYPSSCISFPHFFVDCHKNIILKFWSWTWFYFLENIMQNCNWSSMWSKYYFKNEEFDISHLAYYTTYLVICSGIKENMKWNNIRWKINFVFQTSRNLKIAHSKYLIFYETEMLVIFCVGFLHAPYPTVRLSSLNIVTL